MLSSSFGSCRPVRLRKFDSGVMVIQSVTQSDDEVCHVCWSKSIYRHYYWFIRIRDGNCCLRNIFFINCYLLHSKCQPFCSLLANILDATLLTLLIFHLQVFLRLTKLVKNGDAAKLGVSATEAARSLGMAPALAKEQLLAAESQGSIYSAIFRSIVRNLSGIVKFRATLYCGQGLWPWNWCGFRNPSKGRIMENWNWILCGHRPSKVM